MKTKILDYIDFEKVNTLLEGFNKSTGFVTAILDLDGNVLSKSGWRQICTEFHRQNPETSKKCTISDTELAGKMREGEEYHFYNCLNGLVDVAVPIVINGEHIANLFSGQFFFEKPDINYFKKQAEKFGFEEEEYIKALEKVPVVSKEKVRTAMDFLLNMTQLISEMTFQKVKLEELNKTISESEERFSKIFKASPTAISIERVLDGKLTDVNYTWSKLMGFSAKEAVGRNVEELKIIDSKKSKIIREALINNGKIRQLETKISTKTGEKRSTITSSEVITLGDDQFSINMITDITESKLAEGKLYESEERFRKIFEEGPLGMAMASLTTGKFFRVNKAFSDMLGFTENELMNLTFLDVTYPDDRDKDVDAVKNLYEGQINLYNTEKRYLTKTGEVIWAFLALTKIYSETDQSYYALGMIKDITERKKAETRLNESITLMRIAGEKAKLGGWNVILGKNRTYWSDEVAAIHEMPAGYSPLIEEGINFYAPEWREKITKVFSDCAGKGIPYDEEMEIITAKGKKVWVRTIGEAIRDAQGKIYKVQGAFQDISQRKIEEAKIREKDLQFRKLSSNMPDLIYQFTRRPDGTYCVPIASDGIRNIFGCSPEDVVNDFAPIARVIFPEDTERVIREIEYSAEHMTYFTCEFRVQIPGKPVQWIYSRSTPEKLPDGSITWYGFNTDITYRKESEEAIQQLNSELEKRVTERTSQLADANKELESFSYSVSHDLRSPLRHINGFAELLTKEYSDNLPEAARKHLNTITTSAKKLGTLIDDLLSFSRTGRAELKKSTLKMNQVVEEALAQIKPSVKDRKIDWEISPLPEIQGDYNLLLLVWINLLDNAVKYTSTRKDAIIKIGSRDDKITEIFYIQDNGVGFDMKYADKLFGVFQRLHSSSQFDGTGIGLANVQRIILRHGGRTWAESEPDKGATFYFSIPK
jgi:PAS domain S-box-containing protein